MKRETATRTIVVMLMLAGVAGVSAATTDENCTPEDNLVIAPGTEIVSDEDILLEAECDVEIHGGVIGAPGSGASITIHAGRNILITGLVEAGSGSDGARALNPDGEALAGAARPGGNVVLSLPDVECESAWQCDGGHLFVEPTALIRAGSGGSGGLAASAATSPDNISATPKATGGPGGDGGDVDIVGGSGRYILLGSLTAGSGGDGGDAAALGLGAIALGGAGASPGQVNVTGVSPDHWLLLQQGATAGNGGSATALTALGGPTFYGVPGDDDEDICQAGDVLGLLVSLLPVTIPGFTPGGGSYDANATGGPGGDGLIGGGKGGDARAEACANPNEGTKGDDGGISYYECPADNAGEWPEDCAQSDDECIWNAHETSVICITAQWSPEEGDQGPPGGQGDATGGVGGSGVFTGGPGGAATSFGGTGGKGGEGGKGMRAIGACFDGQDGADGGRGGEGGQSVATGGDGGTTLLITGQPGQGGTASGASGAGGYGGAGGKGGERYPIGVSLEIVSCSSQDGARGDAGDPGPKPNEKLDDGDPGTPGEMTLCEAIAVVSGRDVCSEIDDVVASVFALTDDCQQDIREWLRDGGIIPEAAGTSAGASTQGCAGLLALLDSIGQQASEVMAQAMELVYEARDLLMDCVGVKGNPDDNDGDAGNGDLMFSSSSATLDCQQYLELVEGIFDLVDQCADELGDGEWLPGEWTTSSTYSADDPRTLSCDQVPSTVETLVGVVIKYVPDDPPVTLN